MQGMWKIHGKTHGEHLETMGKMELHPVFFGKVKSDFKRLA